MSLIDVARFVSVPRMRALYAGGNGPVHVRDVAEPTLASPIAAVVRPIAVAVCDLDIAYVLGFLPSERPYAFGHEFTAEVVDVGSAVAAIHVGDIVTVPFQISCGGCSRCRRARSLDCLSVPPLSTYGLDPFGGGDGWGGACAERVVVPYADAMCVLLPTGADPVALASVSDNVADGYRSVAPHVQPGDELLVLGSASVGLYAVDAAVALGGTVTYVDTDAVRLAIAESFGARVVEEDPAGQSFGSFPVVAACTSTPQGLMSAFASTEPGGVCQSSGIQFFGVPEVDYLALYRRGIRFYTGRANARDDIPAILRLVEQGRLHPGAVTGNVISFDEAPERLASEITHKTVITMN
jgi:threonine dehydrogenase-like Zn-dependent dehydrogenase